MPYVKTLDDVLHAYVQHLISRNAKPSSIKQAKYHAHTLVDCFDPIGERTVSQLVKDALDAYVAARLTSVKPASVNGSLRVLLAALRLADEHDALEGGVLPKVKMLKEGRVTVSICTDEEVQALLAMAPTRGVYVALRIAVYAGLRRSEITHLRWMDVDLDAGVLHVTPYGKWSPKNHNEREVPIGSKLRGPLQDACPRTYGGRALVVGGLDDTTIPAIFDKVGITKDRKPGLHMLRRTFASNLLAKGADLESVRDLLGHASIKTTQRYLASTTDRKRAAVEAL